MGSVGDESPLEARKVSIEIVKKAFANFFQSTAPRAHKSQATILAVNTWNPFFTDLIQSKEAKNVNSIINEKL